MTTDIYNIDKDLHFEVAKHTKTGAPNIRAICLEGDKVKIQNLGRTDGAQLQILMNALHGNQKHKYTHTKDLLQDLNQSLTF